VRRTTDELKRAAETGTNVMPALMETARARVTVGESMQVLEEIFGRYRLGAAW